jgi:L-asparaginase
MSKPEHMVDLRERPGRWNVRAVVTVAGLVAATVLAGAQAPATARVTILTTGGTIASRVGASMQDGTTLVGAVPQLLDHAAITVEEVTRVGSSQITPAHWMTLATRINTRFREDRALTGIVVTHGTDTLEDTAFFLHLTVKDPRPVVMTGSMRSANEISADGPANLLNAVRVAVSADASGHGVLVALNEHIASARDVWKTDNRRVETFRSPELGFLGFVDPDGVVFYRKSLRPHTAQSTFEVSGLTTLPAVAMLTDYPGFEAALMDGVLATKPAGVVVAGFAGGRLSAGAREAVQRAASAGVPVVVASHVPGGRIVGNPVGNLAAVVARDLSPNKARVLLMLALTQSRDLKEIQRLFDTY